MPFTMEENCNVKFAAIQLNNELELRSHKKPIINKGLLRQVLFREVVHREL